jgi:hypothetical protein
MADYTPVFPGGVLPFTATVSAAVTGGQLLEVSGNGTVAPAGAASAKVVGVAAHDVDSGGSVTVIPLAGVVHEFVAGTSGVTAGDIVKVGAAANLVVAIASGTYDQRVGIVLTTAAATAKVKVLGR